jgi:hypothetical protein
MRETVLVKLTGDLAELRPDVLDWLRPLAKEYFVVICTGGGTRISERCKIEGIPFEFGPLGRELTTFPGKQMARDELENNQAEIQDKLALERIPATVIIPVLDIGSVLCHVNGDQFVKTAYLGFNKIYVLTLNSRLEKKKEELAALPKIEVVGFPDQKL